MNTIDDTTTIRRLTEQDVNLFREVRLKALKDSPDSFDQKHEEELAKPLEYWQELLDKVSPSSENIAFVLFDDEESIGVVYGFNKGEKRGGLGGLWIDPNYRKRGFATTLINKVITWAKNEELERLTLWNTEGHEGSEKLYRKIGFQPTGRKKPLELNPSVHIEEFELPL